jgi:glycosyltransferase involved in cell wall biosynthesis
MPIQSKIQNPKSKIPSAPSWVCCQLGSREHYAIPRVLHRANRLDLLLTDFWSRHPAFLSSLPSTSARKLAERRHPDLASATIEDVGFSRVLFDLSARHRKWSAWETTFRRDEWFQRRILHTLQTRYLPLFNSRPPGIFFAYSYAARHLLQFFRERGWTTILGQIDPGIEEENLVAAEVERSPHITTSWEPAPAAYWLNWRKEVDLSDILMVNSNWSRQALITSGVPEEKIRVVPLAYEKSSNSAPPRTYAEKFSSSRPLRILFLGQINLRKGIRILFDAFEKLANQPIEFWMVGPGNIEIPEKYRIHPQFHWTGPVSRSEANRYYAEADVFLLPTLSDGFALTQLEAQANGLPVIASKFCGDVVEDGRNGLLLDPLTGDKLAELLTELLRHPERLAQMSRESRIEERFSLNNLAINLQKLEDYSSSINTD